MPTPETSGRTSPVSSVSAALQLCLVNRFRTRFSTAGSMEYGQIWNQKTTPSGLLYWEHTASALRTGDSGYGGWPFPTSQDDNQSRMTDQAREKEIDRRGNVSNLALSASLTGWPSPDYQSGIRGRVSSDPLRRVRASGTKKQLTINEAAQLTGWASPASRDWKDTPGMAETGTNPDGSERNRTDQLPRQAALVPWSTMVQAMTAWATPRSEDAESSGMRHSRGVADTLTAQAGQDLTRGQITSSSPAGTGKCGALNPHLSRWLLGYPPEWCDAAVRAHRALKSAKRAGTRSRS